jgi:5-methylcytosine-specific restriction endonuclease McrA
MKVSPAVNTGSRGPAGLSANVLVLNKLYHPIHVTSARRAFVLLYKNDAEAITLADERLVGFDFSAWIEHSTRAGTTEDDDFVATVSMNVRVPRIVRLLDYERFPIGRVNFSRRNVLARDEYRCQYCGHRASVRELTLDHVIPRSRGGKHCWTNVVAACYRCNDRKGRLTPREANMHLLREPVAPKRSPEIKRKLEEKKYGIWRMFLAG